MHDIHVGMNILRTGNVARWPFVVLQPETL